MLLTYIRGRRKDTDRRIKIRRPSQTPGTEVDHPACHTARSKILPNSRPPEQDHDGKSIPTFCHRPTQPYYRAQNQYFWQQPRTQTLTCSNFFLHIFRQSQYPCKHQNVMIYLAVKQKHRKRILELHPHCERETHRCCLLAVSDFLHRNIVHLFSYFFRKYIPSLSSNFSSETSPDKKLCSCWSDLS